MSRMMEVLHQGRRAGLTPPADAAATHASPGRPAPRRAATAFRRDRDSAARVEVPLKSRAHFLGLDEAAIAAYRTVLHEINCDLDLSQRRLICAAGVGSSDVAGVAAVNLAFAAAHTLGRRTLVVDANLRRSRLASRLGISAKIGLTDILAGGQPPSDAVVPLPMIGIDVLPAGPTRERGNELLGGRRISVLLWELRETYDLVVVAGPTIEFAPLEFFAHAFDGLYLIIEMFQTRRERIDEAMARLRGIESNLRGCILTHDRSVITKSDPATTRPTGDAALAAIDPVASQPAQHAASAAAAETQTGIAPPRNPEPAPLLTPLPPDPLETSHYSAASPFQDAPHQFVLRPESDRLDPAWNHAQPDCDPNIDELFDGNVALPACESPAYEPASVPTEAMTVLVQSQPIELADLNPQPLVEYHCPPEWSLGCELPDPFAPLADRPQSATAEGDHAMPSLCDGYVLNTDAISVTASPSPIANAADAEPAAPLAPAEWNHGRAEGIAWDYEPQCTCVGDADENLWIAPDDASSLSGTALEPFPFDPATESCELAESLFEIHSWIAPDCPDTEWPQIDSETDSRDESAIDDIDLAFETAGANAAADAELGDVREATLSFVTDSGLEALDQATLAIVETVRPFEADEPGCESGAGPCPSDGDVLARTLERDLGPILASSGDAVGDLPASDDPTGDAAPTMNLRRFRIHRPGKRTLESEPLAARPEQAGAACPATAAGSIKGELHAGWASNLLAISGVLLMVAGVLYVAVDLVFWF